MGKVQVDKLTEAQETLLLPLWARAVESKRSSPLMVDEKAVELVEAIDYDFDIFVRKKFNHFGFCGRAHVFDKVVRGFLDRHPSGTVVEVGAGLDTRFDRLDNGTVRWFDLDLPEAMDVRKSFFEETDRRRFLSTSVLETEWFDAVAETNPEALLIVVEGVFYFLTAEQIKLLFSALADRFPGSIILFDSESPLYLRYSNLWHPLSDSKLIWSLSHPRAIEGWDERFHVEESIGFGDSPYWDEPYPRYPLTYRLLRNVCPPVRNMFRVNRVRLG